MLRRLLSIRWLVAVVCFTSWLVACGNTSHLTATAGEDTATVPLAIASLAQPLGCPNTPSQTGSFVTSDGNQFIDHGAPLKLRGYTFYPGSAGGTAAWRSPRFPRYIDHILAMGVQAGQNVVRPTDYWDQHDPGQRVDDPTVWSNLDYLVCAAQQRGMYVVMDISAYKWLLINQGRDFNDASLWKPFIAAVARHYRDAPNIAFYSIIGEPDPPKTPDDSARLVGFYRALTDELHANDPHHLISAGGFTHMEDETPQTPWWQQIFALPHNNVAGYKTYSQDDLDLVSTIATYVHSIHRIMLDEEFGMPQQQGDATFSGGAGYNGVKTSRAEFIDNVYRSGETQGTAGFIFWNIGCDLNDSSYEINPLTPATWQVVLNHAAMLPIGNDQLCPWSFTP